MWLFCYEEGNDNNVIAFFSMFEKKKTMIMCHRFLLWVFCFEKGDNNCHHLLLFFSLFEKNKIMTICRHLLLWVCCCEKGDDSYRCLLLLSIRKEDDDDNLSLFSSMGVLLQKRRR
jgi:hypothetical protein